MTASDEELRRRIDESLKRTQTVPLMKKPIPTELPKVPETPLPPQPYYWPFKSEKEYAEALEKENDRLIVELGNKRLREGAYPWWMALRDNWVKLAIGGVGAFFIGRLSGGCGG